MCGRLSRYRQDDDKCDACYAACVSMNADVPVCVGAYAFVYVVPVHRLLDYPRTLSALVSMILILVMIQWTPFFLQVVLVTVDAKLTFATASTCFDVVTVACIASCSYC